MEHIDILRHVATQQRRKQAVERATGRFYTHESVAEHMIRAIWRGIEADLPSAQPSSIRVIDPFAGDGRLVAWLLAAAVNAGRSELSWDVELWDIDEAGLELGERLISEFAEISDLDVSVNVRVGDAFAHNLNGHQWPIVITNPPWELLKPDPRELADLKAADRSKYVDAMRRYDSFLQERYPRSQPLRRFAGWGTNLSRVGIDLSERITAPGGLLGIVVPASFLADDNSIDLRKDLIANHELLDAAYFPAEARLFGKADVAAATLVLRMHPSTRVEPLVTTYDAELNPTSHRHIHLSTAFLEANRWSIPISFAAGAIDVLKKLAPLPQLGDLETDAIDGLWAGRELDETRIADHLGSKGDGPFIKGRMISRFEVLEQPDRLVSKNGWSPPASTGFERIAWRDVSRPNQKRRMIATLIPPGWIAGNSLGIAHFKDGDSARLRVLLGIMNSVCFEFQLRAHLATGHVSVTALRNMRIPDLDAFPRREDLIAAVDLALAGDSHAETRIEALVAHAYGLSTEDLGAVLGQFPKLADIERKKILLTFCEYASTKRSTIKPALASAKIPNHATANLSELDLQMISHVRPGGNWKQIPESVPSKRLEQIREGFRAGNGSRSTYYGRLHPDRPSYTINTNFNRPGNGCHIHYDPGQNRVLSQREAARLQSFPDDFAFIGPQGAVNTQIGNAVPPLLAYQIASQLGSDGAQFLDLFCGAGGLGLGFSWAGWQPVLASDIEDRFALTYAANVHPTVLVGDLRDEPTFKRLVEAAQECRESEPDRPLWVLGGPPCQGFSTAGNRRSMKDPRNHLVWSYRDFLDAVKPDGFLFENVTGLLNMNGGQVFRDVLKVLGEGFERVESWVLNSEDYAIPQRRSRVFVIATHLPDVDLAPPPRITTMDLSKPDLFEELAPCVTVEDALGDLPALVPGQDGSHLDYRHPALTAFQQFARGELTADAYLTSVRSVPAR